MIWHSNSVADVLQELSVDPASGLSKQEAACRLEEYGHNRSQKPSRPHFLKHFAAHLRQPFTLLVLIVSAVVLILDLYRQALRGEPTQWHWPLLVALVTLVATLLSALRQYHIDSLTDWMAGLSAPDTCVRRDGAEENVSSLVLVPGDIVLLSTGDTVPADCRLITADGLQCDESHLTHTTYPVEKHADTVFDDITPLPQRTNMVYAGTTITKGLATAVVVATGSRSEWGRRPQQQENPITERKVSRLTVWWTVVAVAFGIIAFIIGTVRSNDLSAVWLTSAALITAMVPSCFSTLHSLLAIHSVQQLSRRRVRVLRPAAVDTLGRVTTIAIQQDLLHHAGDASLCRAFTGKQMVDLTESHPKAAGLLPLLRMTALNTTERTPGGETILSRLQSLSVSREELLVDMPCIGELYPTNGHITTIHLADEQTLILSSGEWRSLLSLCTDNSEKWFAAATEMESDGLHVLAVAYRLSDNAPAVYTSEEIERDLTCVGLLGLDAPLSDNNFSVSGARTIVFSNQSTAVAIAGAKSAGLTVTDDALTANDIRMMDDDSLAKTVCHHTVYCGLDTAEQCRVIAALQAQGQIVAVTARNHNEAVLLSTADVGIACGLHADKIAKSAADLILNEGDFAAVRAAMTEGHRLWWKKVALFIYVLVCSIAVLIMGFSGLFGVIPLSYCALLITSVNLLCLVAPTPLWIVSVAVALTQKLCEKS